VFKPGRRAALQGLAGLASEAWTANACKAPAQGKSGGRGSKTFVR
jgi:hypothetical protein